MYAPPGLQVMVINNGDDLYWSQPGDPARNFVPFGAPIAPDVFLTGTPGAPPYPNAPIPSVENFPEIQLIKRTPASATNPNGFAGAEVARIRGNNILSSCKRGWQPQVFHRTLTQGALTPGPAALTLYPSTTYFVTVQLDFGSYHPNAVAQNRLVYQYQTPPFPTVSTPAQLYAAIALQINNDQRAIPFITAALVGNDLQITAVKGQGYKFGVSLDTSLSVPVSPVITINPVSGGPFPLPFYGIGDPGTGNYEQVRADEYYSLNYNQNIWMGHTAQTTLPLLAQPNNHYDFFCFRHKRDQLIGAQTGPEYNCIDLHIYIEAYPDDVMSAVRIQFEYVMNQYLAFYGHGIEVYGIPGGPTPPPYVGPYVPNI